MNHRSFQTKEKKIPLKRKTRIKSHEEEICDFSKCALKELFAKVGCGLAGGLSNTGIQKICPHVDFRFSFRQKLITKILSKQETLWCNLQEKKIKNR